VLHCGGKLSLEVTEYSSYILGGGCQSGLQATSEFHKGKANKHLTK